ncbi:MAG: hypothetical protein A2539_07395 [Elusimicrobia bacterium RIFOXYD2_FULL_34_15]|nr:MAG: hypothetical protein A2539_07395 [Elusimicrobia bacterium RIFOXYD2_FULL_34_15]
MKYLSFNVFKHIFKLLTSILICLTFLNFLFAEGFKIAEVKPKIITPASSSGINDYLIISYDNPNDSNVSGKIITLNGYFVADMLNNDLSAKITWNGKDDSGKVVSSGIYIYQIDVEGKVFNGTVVVAK